ncbi:MAG: pantoate--beta-alanine ligase [Cytophagales bacterium]|nr:MAG: pantoate--beta-alanine ligase [Cytophagales bacterium]
MQICKTLEELKSQIQFYKANRRSIGFVPTMGALHDGHLSLCKAAKNENDVLIVSIFVNPIQFTQENDLIHYPRTEENDIRLLSSIDCDLLFMPTVEVMYPIKQDIIVGFGILEQQLEGKYRPGHFNGVGIVVSKLFHLVQPDKAYFGQKDLQQFLIIRKLVEQLNFPVQLVCCPIARDLDGLALSSRNARIKEEHRAEASLIYQSLLYAAELIKGNSLTEIKKAVMKYFAPTTSLQLEYFEIVDSRTLLPVSELSLPNELAICVACTLGQVRLIDNMLIKI